MIHWLSTDDFTFPPYEETSHEGIIALGGDLQPQRLIQAYSRGVFPWYNQDDPIVWWCPDPRFVLFPQDLKVSSSMKKIIQSEIFTFTENQAFLEVMKSCQKISRKGQKGTWIQPEMIEAYHNLHQLGWAKSVEVWSAEQQLVGGFYGVQVGKMFCGESMFSQVSNASKAGFIQWVQKSQYELIDCQVYTSHLESLGAQEISRDSFLKFLPQ